MKSNRVSVSQSQQQQQQQQQQQRAVKAHLFPIVTIDDDRNKVKPNHDFINLSSIIGSHLENNDFKQVDTAEQIYSTPRNNHSANQDRKPKRPITVPAKKWGNITDKNAVNEDDSNEFLVPVTTPMLLATRSKPNTPPSSHRRKDRNTTLKSAPPTLANEEKTNTTHNEAENHDNDPSLNKMAVQSVVSKKKEPDTLEEHFQKMNYLYNNNNVSFLICI
jgi:hypothetical protein